MQEGSPFSTTSSTFVVVCLFDDGDPYWCEMISHCGFNLHFSDDKQCGASFHVSVGHLNFFFRELSIQLLCPFFNWILCFLFVEACELFIYFDVKPLSDLSFTNIFSHTVGDLFVLLMVSFAVQKLFSLI